MLVFIFPHRILRNQAKTKQNENKIHKKPMPLKTHTVNKIWILFSSHYTHRGYRDIHAFHCYFCFSIAKNWLQPSCPYASNVEHNEMKQNKRHWYNSPNQVWIVTKYWQPPATLPNFLFNYPVAYCHSTALITSRTIYAEFHNFRLILCWCPIHGAN